LLNGKKHGICSAEKDAGENVGSIPVPPKYKSTDFLKADFWHLRGGLDVPKERWVSYPGCERVRMAVWSSHGQEWDHLQQATALAGFYLDMKDNEGWTPERLQPLWRVLQEYWCHGSSNGTTTLTQLSANVWVTTTKVLWQKRHEHKDLLWKHYGHGSQQ